MRYAVSSRTSSYKLEMPGLRKRLCLSEKINQTIMVMITEKKNHVYVQLMDRNAPIIFFFAYQCHGRNNRRTLHLIRAWLLIFFCLLKLKGSCDLDFIWASFSMVYFRHGHSEFPDTVWRCEWVDVACPFKLGTSDGDRRPVRWRSLLRILFCAQVEGMLVS
jgi:hypothetical protein